MRITIVLGIIYLAILKFGHPVHRSQASQAERAGIVWGSIVPQRELV